MNSPAATRLCGLAATGNVLPRDVTVTEVLDLSTKEDAVQVSFNVQIFTANFQAVVNALVTALQDPIALLDALSAQIPAVTDTAFVDSSVGKQPCLGSLSLSLALLVWLPLVLLVAAQAISATAARSHSQPPRPPCQTRSSPAAARSAGAK